MSFCIIDNIIATTINVTDPALDYFLTQAAVEEFQGQQLATNVMQLIGIFKGIFEQIKKLFTL